MRQRSDTLGPATGAVLALALAAAYLTSSSPPSGQHDLCEILRQRPAWYDYARAAEARWEIPTSTLMAFVQVESGFRRAARPPWQYALGVIPWERASSAYGYGQIQDGAWAEYRAARPGIGRSRHDMEDVLDFIGWYNHHTSLRLDVPRSDTKHLYLAYHQGRSGYRSGRWRHDADLIRLAERVAARARTYTAQLERCGTRFECDGLLEFWPLCSTEAE